MSSIIRCGTCLDTDLYPEDSHGKDAPEKVLEIFFFSAHVELLKDPPEKQIEG